MVTTVLAKRLESSRATGRPAMREALAIEFGRPMAHTVRHPHLSITSTLNSQRSLHCSNSGTIFHPILPNAECTAGVCFKVLSDHHNRTIIPSHRFNLILCPENNKHPCLHTENSDCTQYRYKICRNTRPESEQTLASRNAVNAQRESHRSLLSNSKNHQLACNLLLSRRSLADTLQSLRWSNYVISWTGSCSQVAAASTALLVAVSNLTSVPGLRHT